MDEFIPPLVTYLVEGVTETVGIEPTVSAPKPGRWEVRLEGEHVVALGEFRKRGMDGRVIALPGRLWIDGIEVPPTKKMRELRKVWQRYEHGVKDELPELPPATEDPAQAPGAVRKVHDTLIDHQRRDVHGARYSIILAQDEGDWLVGAINADEGLCVIFRYQQVPGTAVWFPEPERSVVMRDFMLIQTNTTDELIDAIQALVGKKPGKAHSSKGSITGGNAETPGKANSVSVRRATVFRV
jgi:hypothetical protein